MIPNASDFDATFIKLEVNEFDDKKSGKELYLTYLDPGKIDMDLKWWPFKDEFLNMAKDLMGVDKYPLYYPTKCLW